MVGPLTTGSSSPTRKKERNLFFRGGFTKSLVVFGFGYIAGRNSHGYATLRDMTAWSCPMPGSTKLDEYFSFQREKKRKEEKLLETIHKELEAHKYVYRNALANNYLKGVGIEIGAKSTPQAVPAEAVSINVDHMSTEDLITKYTGPLTQHKKWVEGIKQNPVLRVDDAETLSTFEDNSLDFIVANHVLEHVGNFLGTLDVFGQKLRVGGIAFFALPDKRFVPEDYGRPVTTPEVFLQELQDKALSKKRRKEKIKESYLYRLRPKGNFDKETIRRARQEAENDQGGALVHTFTTESLVLTLSLARLKLGFPLQLAAIQQVGNENIVVMRKVDATSLYCHATGLSLKNDENCPKDLDVERMMEMQASA